MKREFAGPVSGDASRQSVDLGVLRLQRWADGLAARRWAMKGFVLYAARRIRFENRETPNDRRRGR